MFVEARKQAIMQLNMLRSRDFVRDVFTLQVGSVFAQGIGFVKSILLARLLGLEGFGVYAIVLSMTGTLKIFTGFGQEQAFTTYAAEQYGSKNTKGLTAVYKYFMLMSSIATGLLLVFAALSPWLSSVLYESYVRDVGQVAQVAFIGFAIGMPHAFVTGMLQTVRKIKILTAMENANLLLQLLLSVGFVWWGMGVMGVFIGLLCSNALMTVAYIFVYLLIKEECNLPGVWQSVASTEAVRPYLTQGFFISIDKNIINFYQQALLFIFGIFTAPTVVGLAQIAVKISNVPASLFFAHAVRMAGTVIPSLKSQGIHVLRKHCALLVKHAVVFHSIIVFASMITFPFIILFAYGQKYAGVIYPVEWILLIRLLQPFNVATSPLLRVFKKMHVSTIWNGIRVILELTAFMYLLQFVFVDRPLIAFVFAILFHQIGAFLLNFYVYGNLVKMRLS